VLGPRASKASASASEEKDEEDSSKDELLLQAKWGGINPTAKRCKWR
jgi:hypothetical protein